MNGFTNYGYQNPNFYPDRMAPAPIPTTQALSLSGVPGKVVNDFSEITMQDIPMNCQPAYFVKADMSEIQMRKWTDDCRVIMQSFKPEITSGEEKKDPFEGIMKRFDAIEERLDRLSPTARKKVTADE